MTIDKICQALEQRRDHGPNDLHMLVHELALHVRELSKRGSPEVFAEMLQGKLEDGLSVKVDERCSVTSGDGYRCVLTDGHKPGHRFQLAWLGAEAAVDSHGIPLFPWPKIDAAVKAAEHTQADPAWEGISKECGTAPAAWARALVRSLGWRSADIETTLAAWFEHAMLTMASSKDEGVSNVAVLNAKLNDEAAGLRNGNRELSRRVSELDASNERLKGDLRYLQGRLADELDYTEKDRPLESMLLEVGKLHSALEGYRDSEANRSSEADELGVANRRLQRERDLAVESKEDMVTELAETMGHPGKDVAWSNLIAQARGLRGEIEGRCDAIAASNRVIQDQSMQIEGLNAKLARVHTNAELLEEKVKNLTEEKAHAEELGNLADKALDKIVSDVAEQLGCNPKEDVSWIIDQVGKLRDKCNLLASENIALRQRDKQHDVTKEQLDKFQSVCADQAIQIMELRALKAVKLSTARDVLKNIDAIGLKLEHLGSDHAVSHTHTWQKARMFTSEARDWLAEAIRKADS